MRSACAGSLTGIRHIDWAADSAFRFFPIERDPLLGWRLHLFDAATNKALTLAARTETRDYVDIIEFHKTFPLATICWAACGKDPGFTPLSLLKMMRRLFDTLAAKTSFDPSQKLNLKDKPGDTTNWLWNERKVPVLLMEQRISTSKKLGRHPTVEDRIAFGKQLITVMAETVLE